MTGFPPGQCKGSLGPARCWPGACGALGPGVPAPCSVCPVQTRLNSRTMLCSWTVSHGASDPRQGGCWVTSPHELSHRGGSRGRGHSKYVEVKGSASMRRALAGSGMEEPSGREGGQPFRAKSDPSNSQVVRGTSALHPQGTGFCHNRTEGIFPLKASRDPAKPTPKGCTVVPRAESLAMQVEALTAEE